MAMSLGLESLVEPKSAAPNNEVSYEFLDAVFEYNEACENLNIIFDLGETLFRAAQNLKAVSDVIKEQGVTPALEALVGENFDNGLSEASVEAASQGVGAKIKEWFIQFWNAIKEFFLKYFNNVNKHIDRIDAWIRVANKADESNFTSHSCIIFDDIRPLVTKEAVGRTLANGDPVYEISTSNRTLNFSGAKRYAEFLKTWLLRMKNDQERFKAFCEEQIKKAKNIQSDEDRKVAKMASDAIKKFLNQFAKQLISASAAFLAHNTISNVKDNPIAKKQN